MIYGGISHEYILHNIRVLSKTWNISHPNKKRIPLKDFDHVLLWVPAHLKTVAFRFLFGHCLLTSFDELILPRMLDQDELTLWRRGDQNMHACLKTYIWFPNCPCWNCSLWTQGPSPNDPVFSTPHATILVLGVSGPHYPWICPRTTCASVPWGPPWCPCP